MKNRIDVEEVIKLFSKSSSTQILKDSWKILKPKKENIYSFFFLISICIIPAIIIGVSVDTIELFGNAVENINEVILTMFGIVFTGYAFFQALIDKELLKRLLTTLGNDKNLLEESNEYFVNIMMLNVLAIIINIFLLLTIKSLPLDFYVFNSLYINNTLAFISIWGYFSFMMLIIWEIKSFVFNIFQLFNAYAGAKSLELLDEQNEGDE